ncbi:hypothetical protein BHAP_1756 [Bifidobacterium hapali]|uniref:Uncharacterized protein n=1 Tax=Bifidobacterium hapali TaxID=1630172 RepID=A0A261FWT8_9BIFI|nr:hypothetical protein BHAP_1756 [Bifidobacterium hapali]
MPFHLKPKPKCAKFRALSNRSVLGMRVVVLIFGSGPPWIHATLQAVTRGITAASSTRKQPKF